MKWQLLKNRKVIAVIIYWIAVLIWMGVIFKLSSQPAVQSGKLSTGIADMNIKAINKVTPNTKFSIEKYDHMLRKNAHFFIYLVLGILLVNALKRSGVVRYKSIDLLICILYAISDELHQVFVPGRGPGVGDILIDTLGASSGILICLILGKIGNRLTVKTTLKQ